MSKYFKKILLRKFGSIKKLLPSLHSQNSNMSRLRLHIETVNRFSPMGYDSGCGACYAEE